MKQRQHAKGSIKNFLLAAGVLWIVITIAVITGTKISDYQNQVFPSYSFQTVSLEAAKQTHMICQSDVSPGTKIDEYQGIAVYSNGTNYMSRHGLSYSNDGYYYGYKWQCVEFVKRFFYEKYNHKMPDGAGNAKYFFNPMLGQGELNPQRGLVQYQNGGDVKPEADDLLVFADSVYGHVAIISEVGDGWLEVVQQNSETPREKYNLTVEDGKYLISGKKEAIGWLRLANR